MSERFQRAIRKFREVHCRHRRVIERRIADTGVFRSQHMTLMFLARHEGCSQKEIAEAHNISTAAVAVNLQKLEKAGMVERCPDAKDSRRNVITITEKGLSVVRQSREIFASVDERIFAGIPEEEIVRFEQTMEKMLKNLQEMEDELAKTEESGETSGEG